MKKIILLLIAMVMCTPSVLYTGKVQARDTNSDTYKELSAVKLNTFKEGLQKDMQQAQGRIEAQDKRIDRQDKLLDLQTDRIGDLSFTLTAFGMIFAVIAILAGWVGYFTIKNRAKEEARQVATEWFARDGNEKINTLLAEFKSHLDSQKDFFEGAVKDEIQKLQERMQATPELREPPKSSIPTSGDPLQQLVEQLKQKPESDYAFGDWNARAFDAYRQGHRVLASEYWLKAANSRNPKRIEMAMSVFNAATTLSEEGNYEKAVELYDELLARFGAATELDLREQVARSLANKMYSLSQLGRHDDVIKVGDELVSRFGTATDLVLSEGVSRALLNKSAALGRLGRHDESIKVNDDLLARLGAGTDLSLRENIAHALSNRVIALGHLGRYDEAIRSSDDFLARFGAATEPTLRRFVPRIENSKGFAHLNIAKQQWNDKTERDVRLQNAFECFTRSISNAEKNARPVILGNQAYVLFLLKRTDDARKILRQAFIEGGEGTRDEELRDTELNPIVEDESFRTLIWEIWRELHPHEKTN